MNDLVSAYYQWLYAQIGAVTDTNPYRSHHILSEILLNTEFVSYNQYDDNRAFEGLQLRAEFAEIHGEVVWADEPCTVFEVLLALARRAAYETSGFGLIDLPGDWFWRMLGNLGLDAFNDGVFLEHPSKMESIVHKTLLIFLERRYNSDGSNGGLFPLKEPNQDQRQVELWYQLNAYILEMIAFSELDAMN